MIDAATTAAIIAAVRQAAKAEILPRFRHPELAIEAKSSPNDLVTDADLAMEAALEAGLAAILPEARVLGEEAASKDPSLIAGLDAPGVSFVIDPIDGTWNFANSLAHFGVALAVVADGITLFGLLYDPIADDWIAARKGAGVWFGRPDAADRAIGFQRPANGGFLHVEGVPHALRAVVLAAASQFGRATTLQCSVQEYRTMLLGQAGFSLNAGLAPWDHLAGILAIEEAGGVARLLDGRAYRWGLGRGRLLVARSEEAWQKLHDSFAPHLVATDHAHG